LGSQTKLWSDRLTVFKQETDKMSKKLFRNNNNNKNFFPEEMLPKGINQRKVFNIAPDNKFLNKFVERAVKSKIMQRARTHYSNQSFPASSSQHDKRIQEQEEYQRRLAKKIMKTTGKSKDDLLTCTASGIIKKNVLKRNNSSITNKSTKPVTPKKSNQGNKKHKQQDQAQSSSLKAAKGKQVSFENIQTTYDT